MGVTTTRWATFKLTGVHLALAWENQGNGAASPPLPLVSGNHWHARRGPANLNTWRHLRSASLTKSQTRQTTFQVFRGRRLVYFFKNLSGLMLINCFYLKRTTNNSRYATFLQPTTCRSSATLQEHSGRYQRHPRKRCHHGHRSPPAARRLPCGGSVCDQRVFQGESEGSVRGHHPLKRKR